MCSSRPQTASGSLRVINVSCPAFPLISMSNPCIANGFNYMIDSSGAAAAATTRTACSHKQRTGYSFGRKALRRRCAPGLSHCRLCTYRAHLRLLFSPFLGNMVLVPIFSQLPSNLCGPWIAAIDRSTITAATRTVTLLVGFTQSIFTQDVNMTIAADGLTLSVRGCCCGAWPHSMGRSFGGL